MARPQKNGLDYFPFDVDFFDDEKITAVFVEFGLKGEIAAIKLLCAIYRQGYFTEWKDSVRIKLLKTLPGVSEELLEKIVNRLVRWGFFDKNLFDSAGVLTSHGIQKRYFSITRRNKRLAAESLPHLLIEFPHVETQLARAEIQLTNVESTQKESKEKDNNSLRSSLSLSSSTTSTSRVRDGDGENPKDGAPVDVQTVVDELRVDRDWLLSMQHRHGIEAQKIIGWLNAFVVECNCRGTQEHQDKSDVMRHFNDWLMIQLKQKRGDKGKVKVPVTQSAKDLWIRAKAELCASVSAEQSATTFDLMEYQDFLKEKNRLVVTVPTEDVYNRLESQPYVRQMQITLRKFFGSGVCLGYLFRNPPDKE